MICVIFSFILLCVSFLEEIHGFLGMILAPNSILPLMRLSNEQVRQAYPILEVTATVEPFENRR
jgi:hypothetical protein